LGDDRLVAELLTTQPFRNVHGVPWRWSGKAVAHAPATNAAWHIVPRNYDACFVEVSAKSCARCHETTLEAATTFHRTGTGGGMRDWYGRVRGSDQIFSFHPFHPGSISPNGQSRTVAMNPRLAGIVERYDPRRHPASVYSRLR
jgi:hypothetical protein